MIRVEKPAPEPDHSATLAELRKAKKAITRAQKALRAAEGAKAVSNA